MILQHHDEYGEPARTLYAHLAYMIDNMEATLSSIDEMLCDGQYSKDAAVTKIKFNDRYLSIYDVPSGFDLDIDLDWF